MLKNKDYTKNVTTFRSLGPRCLRPAPPASEYLIHRKQKSSWEKEGQRTHVIKVLMRALKYFCYILNIDGAVKKECIKDTGGILDI